MNLEGRHSFVLPATFEPCQFLPERLHRRADDARYIVSTILWKRAYGRTDERGRVPLMGRYLKRIMATHDYKAVLDSLLERGVICRDRYVVGETPYSYWLDDRYRADAHVRVDATDRRLIRAMDRFRCEQADEQASRMRPVHRHLQRIQFQLGIDAEQAAESLLALPSARNGFDSQGVLVRDLRERRLHFSVGRYGRVANSITNLSRHVRPSLHHRGDPLHQIDIRCCQPGLLGQLVNKHSGKKQAGEKGEGAGPRVTTYDSQNEPLGGVGLASLERYLTLTQSGVFYDFLVSEMDGMTRDEIKKRFLCDVLAKRKANNRGGEYQSRLEDRFAALFPPVYRFIRTVNKHGWEHANLIRQLQQAESSLVIGQVCESIRQTHPKMFLVTLHDAIFATEQNMPTIRSEFDRAFDASGHPMSLSLSGPTA